MKKLSFSIDVTLEVNVKDWYTPAVRFDGSEISIKFLCFTLSFEFYILDEE